MHFWTEVQLGCELGCSFWRTDAFLDRGAIRMWIWILFLEDWCIFGPRCN